MTSVLDTRSAAARRERDGVLLCALAAAAFAALVVMAKLAYGAGANIVTLLTVRFGVAAVVLWALAARLGVARRATRRDALVALALGFGLYSVETALMFGALARIDASLAELLVFTYPAMVVLGAVLLRREVAGGRQIVALGAAMAGVALVLLGSAAGALDPLGAALALGAALLYAVYVLAAAVLGGRLHPVTLAALVATGAAVAFAGVGGAFGTLQLGMSAAAWGWGVAIALGSTVVALAAFLGGVARLGPSRASILATLEPPIAVVLAALVLGERPGPLQVLGGLLVLSAAVVLQVRSRDRGAPARSPHRTAARALGQGAAGRARVGVRAQVGRLPRDRVRRRRRGRDPVARR